MTARKPEIERLPFWPRLLSREQAASYCGVSPNFFDAHVAIPATMIGTRKLYDRHALDRWIDALSDGTINSSSIWLDKLDADRTKERPHRSG